LLGALEKLDGRSFETQGKKKYECGFLAVVTYSCDTLQCRIKLWPELPNYLVEVDKTERKAKIAGWLSLIVAIFAPMRHCERHSLIIRR